MPEPVFGVGGDLAELGQDHLALFLGLVDAAQVHAAVPGGEDVAH